MFLWRNLLATRGTSYVIMIRIVIAIDVGALGAENADEFSLRTPLSEIKAVGTTQNLLTIGL